MIRTNFLLPIIVVAGGVTPSATMAAEQTFASSAVMNELSATRPEFSSLQPDEQFQLHIWLLANCAVGADTRRKELLSIGSRSELVLVEAFRMGPPVAFLAELANSRRNDLAAIREQLRGEDRELFEADLQARVNEIAENSWVNDGINQTVLSYRLAALDGIAAVGTNTSIAWLERTTSTLETPELRRAAERALDTLRKRWNAAKY